MLVFPTHHFLFFFYGIIGTQKNKIQTFFSEKKLSNMTSKYTTKNWSMSLRITMRQSLMRNAESVITQRSQLFRFLKNSSKNIRQIPFLTTNFFYYICKGLKVFFMCIFISSTLFLQLTLPRKQKSTQNHLQSTQKLHNNK
jgi:hypothetical protein